MHFWSTSCMHVLSNLTTAAAEGEAEVVAAAPLAPELEAVGPLRTAPLPVQSQAQSQAVAARKPAEVQPAGKPGQVAPAGDPEVQSAGPAGKPAKKLSTGSRREGHEASSGTGENPLSQAETCS